MTQHPECIWGSLSQTSPWALRRVPRNPKLQTHHLGSRLGEQQWSTLSPEREERRSQQQQVLPGHSKKGRSSSNSTPGPISTPSPICPIGPKAARKHQALFDRIKIESIRRDFLPLTIAGHSRLSARKFLTQQNSICRADILHSVTARSLRPKSGIGSTQMPALKSRAVGGSRGLTGGDHDRY